MQINVAIIEDERPFMQQLCDQLKRWAMETLHQPYIRWYSDAGFFLAELERGIDFDILFVDIKLPGPLNGIEVAKQVRDKNGQVAIVFVTSAPEYIAEGYRVAAMQYLLKPVPYEELRICMDRLVENIGIRGEQDYCFYKGKNSIARIPYSKILYFSSALQYTDIYTTTGVERQLERLKNIEETLPEHFVRCHRSYIVNMKAVSAISPNFVTMVDRSKIPLSKTYFEEVKVKFLEL